MITEVGKEVKTEPILSMNNRSEYSIQIEIHFKKK